MTSTFSCLVARDYSPEGHLNREYKSHILELTLKIKKCSRNGHQLSMQIFYRPIKKNSGSGLENCD
jgi:hypothetical protein